MQYSIQPPPLTQTNKVILIVLGIFFLIENVFGAMVGFSLKSILGFSYRGFVDGGFFQLFTYPLIQPGFLSAIFNGLVIWFLGAEMEQILGRQKYILMMISSVLAGAVFYFLVTLVFGQSQGSPLLGISGVISALCLLYGLKFKDRMMTAMFLFPMKAIHFCLFLITLELLFAITPGYGLSSVGNLGAMLGAYLFDRYFFKGKKMIKKAPIQERNKGRNLYIVKNDDDDKPPKYWQ